VLSGSTNIQTKDSQTIITIDSGESASTRSDGKETSINQSYEAAPGQTKPSKTLDEGSLFTPLNDKALPPGNLPLDNESLFDDGTDKDDSSFDGCLI
jgi:hypothetical protein